MNIKFVFCTFFLLVASTVLFSNEQETQFLETWVNLLKNDPKTVELTKIDEKTFQFKTTQFPYDGKLVVSSVTIEEYPTGRDRSLVKVALVEFDLPDLNEEGRTKIKNSLHAWKIKYTHRYYDDDTQKWLNYKEFSKKMQSSQPESKDGPHLKFMDLFLTYGGPIIIIILVFTTFLSSRKATLSMERQMQSLEFQKKTLAKLEEILEVLKQKKQE